MPGRNAGQGSRSSPWASMVEGVRSQLWPLPFTGVVLAVGLGLVIVHLDAWADDQLPSSVQALLFSGDGDAARSVLNTVAGSMITVTSLTFSLTVVTLQLASSQFSPRLLRTFAADGFVQGTLTLFLVTFVYALVVLRSVHSDTSGTDRFVPRFAVTLSVLLTLASVLALVLFLAHLAREIRVETMLTMVHADASATIRRELAPAGGPTTSRGVQPPRDARAIDTDRSGFLVGVDVDRLLEVAQRTGTVIWVDRPIGSSVIAGTPVAFTWKLQPDGSSSAADANDEMAEQVRRCLTISFERSGGVDISFGLRQVTDVAVKALSPGINDPTTATVALGHSAAILCLLATRDTGLVYRCDEDDQVRIGVARAGFAELLELALEQPRRHGAIEPAVIGRILQLLREVAWATRDPDRTAALTAELGRTSTTIDRQDFDTTTRERLQAQVELVRAATRGDWQPSGPDPDRGSRERL